MSHVTTLDPQLAPSQASPSQPQSPDEEKGSFKDESSDSAVSSVEDLLAKHSIPPDGYESKHRYDPNATWTPQEEAKLRRKLDWRVCTFVCFCFAALQLDRGNISNALSDNLLSDLKLTTNDYNTGQTIFYLFFLAAELPSQLISKKVGVDKWVPTQMMLWSIVAICQAALTGKVSFYITRALLGLLEGGFIADMILYLSYYYTAAELTMRLSWFWVSLTGTNIIGSLLAAGLLKLGGHHGLEGWRWLFLIEGIFTFSMGVFAAFYLPPSPTQTASCFRGKKGWFNEREEIIIVNKVLRDDPTKSSMHNREGLTLKSLGKSLADYDLWGLYLLGLTSFIAPATVGAYFTLTLKSLGFTTFQTNLLTIPSSLLFILNNLALASTSKKVKESTLIASIGSWWQLIFVIVLVTIPNDTNKWSKFAILTLLLAYPYAHPILVSMNSRNAGSVRTRTVASSVYNMFVQAGSLVASNIYRTTDKPYYHNGNKILLGIISANLVIFGLNKLYFIYRNRSKAAKWDRLTIEEKDAYLEANPNAGNKRLDFRFEH